MLPSFTLCRNGFPRCCHRDAECNFKRTNSGYHGVRLCSTWWSAEDILTQVGVEELLMGLASQIAEREDSVLCSDVRGESVASMVRLVSCLRQDASEDAAADDADGHLLLCFHTQLQPVLPKQKILSPFFLSHSFSPLSRLNDETFSRRQLLPSKRERPLLWEFFLFH